MNAAGPVCNLQARRGGPLGRMFIESQFGGNSTGGTKVLAFTSALDYFFDLALQRTAVFSLSSAFVGGGFFTGDALELLAFVFVFNVFRVHLLKSELLV